MRMVASGASQGNKERRTALRYDLSLPVEVRSVLKWQAEPFSGWTRDISACGIYFTIDQGLFSCSRFNFTLTLPAEITHGSQDSFVRAQGKVVRVEKKRENGKERVGVAAVILKHELIRSKPRLS
jgi:c-di-GMP-binding flagellar brake protein YcgR